MKRVQQLCSVKSLKLKIVTRIKSLHKRILSVRKMIFRKYSWAQETLPRDVDAGLIRTKINSQSNL